MVLQLWHVIALMYDDENFRTPAHTTKHASKTQVTAQKVWLLTLYVNITFVTRSQPHSQLQLESRATLNCFAEQSLILSSERVGAQIDRGY
jgi:hypothetical protein